MFVNIGEIVMIDTFEWLLLAVPVVVSDGIECAQDNGRCCGGGGRHAVIIEA